MDSRVHFINLPVLISRRLRIFTCMVLFYVVFTYAIYDLQ